ncbi:hypothetical protein ONA23_00500 [Mycoplasmopsis cynos]|nr:hypothetical protein [Mycoplasmopsis cynos]MCU9934863.1 hypothetical protein [Mycoplasmopsis cynos]WAM06747.1 hypothetical protein ONA23_00500 [Mycoplasmopsis cynos]
MIPESTPIIIVVINNKINELIATYFAFFKKLIFLFDIALLIFLSKFVNPNNQGFFSKRSHFVKEIVTQRKKICETNKETRIPKMKMN